MIHFNETSEKKDIPELLSSLALSDIIPEHLSGNDSRTFWDVLFCNNSRRDTFEIDMDSVWAEIFGRDECEFQFDFEIDEGIRAILDKFEPFAWYTLTDGEKICTIQQFVSILSNKLDLDESPEIIFFDSPSTSLGAFDPSHNRVELNVSLLDHPDILRSVIPHEMRHAYQHKRAGIQENWMDVLYLINFENYITPVWLDNSTCLYYTDYNDQLVEAEARAFAELFS